MKQLQFLFSFLMIFILYGCHKDDIDTLELKTDSTQAVGNDHLNALRESFEGKGYDEFLSEIFFSGDSILYWKAHWAGYSYRIDTVVTTYVPLTPSLDENKIDIGKKEIKVQGFRKFIVFVESSRSTEYFIVTYISDNPDHSQKPFNFNSFTGTVLVNDLKFNKVSLLKYKGGKISRKGDKGANGEIMATACTTSQVCSWGGSCDSGLTITYTSGNVEGGGCSYPSGVSGCGNNTEWYLSYSYFDTDCSSGTYNPGVPPGGGGPGGGGGGSSGGDPSGPTNPGDGEMTPIEDPDKPCPGDPVKSPKVAPSNKFGNVNGGRRGHTRTDNNGNPKWHGGLDVEAPIGSPIYNMYDGRVTRVIGNIPNDASSYCPTCWGNLVEIETTFPNGEKVRILYAHFSSVNSNLYVGLTITAGTPLGLSGKTGNAWKASGSPHVHLNVWKNNVEVNPEDYLSTKFDRAANVINVPC